MNPADPLTGVSTTYAADGLPLPLLFGLPAVLDAPDQGKSKRSHPYLRGLLDAALFEGSCEPRPGGGVGWFPFGGGAHVGERLA